MLRPHHLAIICATVALVGCLAAAPSALGAAGQTITVVERQIDVNPGETNPCTGATGTIVDDEQDVFHLTSLADGSTHLSAHGITAITFVPDTADGVSYQGHETFDLSLNGDDDGYTTTTTQHVRVRAPMARS